MLMTKSYNSSESVVCVCVGEVEVRVDFGIVNAGYCRESYGMLPCRNSSPIHPSIFPGEEKIIFSSFHRSLCHRMIFYFIFLIAKMLGNCCPRSVLCMYIVHCTVYTLVPRSLIVYSVFMKKKSSLNEIPFSRVAYILTLNVLQLQPSLALNK